MKNVYDILNAGDNHRFMIRNPNGEPFIVGNCTQSLARDIIAKHTMDINKSYWVAGLVHDEVIAVVPDDQVEQAKIDITNIMRTPPTWAPDLPLDCEVGSGKRYGEAK